MGIKMKKTGIFIKISDKAKRHYLNDFLHREDGPAIEFPNGNKEYYISGIEYLEEYYWKEIKKRKSLNYILSSIRKKYNEPDVIFSMHSPDYKPKVLNCLVQKNRWTP